MIEQILNKLNKLKDLKYKDFSSSLNPTALPMLGVRIPELRKIAKEIEKDNPKYFLEHNPMTNFELVSLQAMVIGYMKEDIVVVLKYLEAFIPKINDWSVNDTVCQTFKIAKKHQKEVWDFLCNYFNFCAIVKLGGGQRNG